LAIFEIERLTLPISDNLKTTEAVIHSFFSVFDVSDAGGRCSCFTPQKHRFSFVAFPLENSLHSAVREIFHPPGKSEAEGLFDGVCPKEDPLDASGNLDVESLFI